MFKIFYNLRRLFYTYLCFIQSKNKEVLKCNINGYCRFSADVTFGKNNNFNGCKILGKGKVEIGDNFHSAENLIVLTSFHNYEGNALPYDHSLIVKNVVIEDNVWIGLNVIILGGVHIGEGAIIQAGSVVSKSVGRLEIVGGSPARPFKKRDEIHYNELKMKNMFM